jgi:hypothetical protein
LTDPSRLPDEARQAASKQRQDQQSNGTHWPSVIPCDTNSL